MYTYIGKHWQRWHTQRQHWRPRKFPLTIFFSLTIEDYVFSTSISNQIYAKDFNKKKRKEKNKENLFLMSPRPDAVRFDGYNTFDTLNTQFIQFEKGKITEIMHSSQEMKYFVQFKQKKKNYNWFWCNFSLYFDEKPFNLYETLRIKALPKVKIVAGKDIRVLISQPFDSAQNNCKGAYEYTWVIQHLYSSNGVIINTEYHWFIDIVERNKKKTIF